MIAVHSSADRVERVVRQVKQRQRLDDVQELIRQRSFTCAWDEDGSLVVRARLTPEQGAVWLKALEKAQGSLDAADPEQAFEVRQADAMTHAMEESLNDGAGSSRSGDRYQVMVHVPAETLCSDAGMSTNRQASTRPAEIEQGPPLHPETVKRLTCDGALVTVLEDKWGEVLNVGRKTRVIPPSIRRALKVRDSHCQFPGCCHDKYVDGHHIVHWANGGETSLDNLLLLCRRHHRYVHEHGYSISKSSRRLPDEERGLGEEPRRFTFTRPGRSGLQTLNRNHACNSP